jgi:2-methylcitrate dehydratase
MSHQKPVPAETQALGLLDLVPKILAWTPVDEIESIEIETTEHAAEHIADPPKYDPRTRETADHSLPYMIAVALADGSISLDSYRPERFLDPALRPLMQKIRVLGNHEFSELRRTKMYGVSRQLPSKITIRTRAGDEFSEQVLYHRGHYMDPMTRDDINRKLGTICEGVVDDAQRERIRGAWWNVGSATDIADPIRMLASFE